jgi:F-box protein 11
VAEIGRIANLTLRQVRSYEWYGVDIAQGRLDLEDCDISSKGNSCVVIHSGADPRLRRNRIHDGNGIGVFIYRSGKGILEDNEIFANAGAGVMIGEGGTPILRRNHITQNGYKGVWVRSGGGGIFEDRAC